MRPAPADAARGQLLDALLRAHPAAIKLACYVNSQGVTPVHLAVLSASGQVLAALVGSARRTLGRRAAALLLSVPDAKGRSALDLAIASQQWEAAALLADTARLTHAGATAAAAAARASMPRRTSSAGASPGAGAAIAGAVGGAINRLWDSLGGDRAESQSVTAHRQQGEPQAMGVAAVAVLGELEAVQARRQRQIEAVAAAAGVGALAAEACLAKRGWNEAEAVIEAAALQQNTSNKSPMGQMCLVCFEKCGSGEDGDGVAAVAARALPCGHVTCDACLEGVYQAAPQGACCPEPSCRLPLPLAAACAALPPAKFQRAARLAAEAYVQATPDLRWCPAPGCSRCLERSGAVAVGAGLDAACACGAACCWACGDAAHEPASCAQARAWGEELQALRAAAPTIDRQWLQTHARRCPGCDTPTQRSGGCNHMTCVACSKHWCWECGREWREHSADTGGFYFCSLDPAAARGGGGDAAGGEDAAGGWLRQVWSAVAGVASQATLNRALQMHLRHEVDPGAVAAVATHLRRLADRLGLGSGGAAGDGAEDRLEAAPGPEEVGVAAGDVARMEPHEWALFLSTACRSAADAGAFELADREESPGSSQYSSPPSSPRNEGRPAAVDAAALVVDAAALAAVLTEAHAALHHAAAVMRALPGGARRRYFQELCDEAERCLAAVEPLLMGAPFQAEAAAAGALPELPSHGGPLSGLRGALSALLQRWRRVPAPRAEGRLPGAVPAQVVVAQAHYVMHTLGREGGRAAEGAEALRRATAAMKDAARRGLFA